MISPHRLLCFGAAMLAITSLAAGAQTPAPLPSSQMVSPKLLVTRIDLNCAVFRNAIKSQPPKDVLLVKASTWKLASADDVVAAERTHASTTHAEVWKQAGNLVWVHWVTHGATGNRHAVQLCFRTDGTLARVKQGTTVPSLDGAAVRQAYYNTNGAVIQKSAMFSVNDPAIYKQVKDLPFFSIVSSP
jgi:hypothetical protein